jgi:O-antigen/teichoic acid export membrane protein
LINTIGLVGATIAMWVSRIILFYLSYRIIDKNKEISFDRWYLAKNLIGIGILSIIMYYIQNRVFILEDIYRYKNLMYLIMIFIGYYICIAGMNYKSIALIKKEFTIIRKSK